MGNTRDARRANRIARRTIAAGLALLLSSLLTGLAQDQPAKEQQIKAAYVYNFPKFVEWPETRFSNDAASVIIGVVGSSPIASELRELARERKINGRSFEVRSVHTAAEAAAVHVLFVGAAEEKQGGALLSAVREKAVLTIGESDKFAEGGGIITFVREANKIRFRISVESARRAGLIISAQLRQLAEPPKRE